MSLSPFKVGDRIQAIGWTQYGDNPPVCHVADPEFATVTELTERGFRYDYGHPKPFIPRWGLSFMGCGEVFCDMEGYDPAINWRLVEDSEGEPVSVSTSQQITTFTD